MKRWIRGSRSQEEDVERITIDFYPDLSILEDIDSEEEVSAARKNRARTSNIKQVFKNKAQNVIDDITAYLESKNVKILHVKKSSRKGSDSTYFDVDISVITDKGPKYIFFRISDHNPPDNPSGSRLDYYRRKAESYEGIALTKEEADELFYYCDISVTGVRYNNYDRALNRVKYLIDVRLRTYGIE